MRRVWSDAAATRRRPERVDATAQVQPRRRRLRATRELLTLKAVQAIRAATVLLVDDLVSDGRALARRRTRIVHVGKRGGCRARRRPSSSV